jgi:hypothetical protein
MMDQANSSQLTEYWMRRYVEGWLRARGSASAAAGESILGNLTYQTPTERMRLAWAVVDDDVNLAHAVKQLSVCDQLRLSVDLLQGTTGGQIDSTGVMHPKSTRPREAAIAVITRTGRCAGPHHPHRLPRQ